MWSTQSRSPPPLQHPIPTHPHYIPEPPDTPVSSSGGGSGSQPDNYVRFSSESARPPIETILNPSQAPPHSFGATGAQGHHSFAGNTYRSPTGYGAYPNPPNVYTQQQSQQHPPSYGGAPWGVNDTTAAIGLQIAGNAVHAGQEYMQRNFGFVGVGGKGAIKDRFNVSNGYVLRKLGIILAPWRVKGWARKFTGVEGEGANAVPRYASPREDINSPDLYIPSMALVTYILLSALRAGLDNTTRPEQVLAAKTSTALTIIILECLFVRIGCYALGVEAPSQLLDILAYTTYKFVPSTVLLLLRILHWRASLYWSVFLYLFAANGFFLLRSLRAMVLSPSSASTSTTSTASNMSNRHQHTLRSYRVIFLFAVAVGQVPGMWFLS